LRGAGDATVGLQTLEQFPGKVEIGLTDANSSCLIHSPSGAGRSTVWRRVRERCGFYARDNPSGRSAL